MGHWVNIAAAGALLICAACTPPEDKFTAKKVTFGDLSGWDKENHAQAREVFLASCEAIMKPEETTKEKSGIVLKRDDLKPACEAAKKTVKEPQTARLFFEHYFVPFSIANHSDKTGLFTGYYEPLLYGSTVKRGDFIYPIYGKPKDLKEGEPYLTREEIDTRGLKEKAPVLAWVDDEAMLFFLHVQGSGRIRFANGKDMRIGYAGKNGHPYVSIGKIMKEEGLVEEDRLNFFGIRHWLYKNPEKAQAMMWRNPSYVFFRKLKATAPKGAIGVPLTAKRSLAVDKHHIPYGLPLYLQTELPAGPEREATPFNRLMIAQDTGGAIKGPVRGDVFFGFGDEAEYYAGHMKSEGSYVLLMPKPASKQLQ